MTSNIGHNRIKDTSRNNELGIEFFLGEQCCSKQLNHPFADLTTFLFVVLLYRIDVIDRHVPSLSGKVYYNWNNFKNEFFYNLGI